MDHAPGIKLSVIIPTLNEAGNLPALLDDLKRQINISMEIVITDGASSDETLRIADSFEVRTLSARRGRGAQMNAGAAVAEGEYFLFLHADSRIDDPLLLSNAVAAVGSGQQNHDRIAGHFPLHFIRSTEGNKLAYRYAEAKSHLNRINTTNGDQGLLLSQRFFRDLGGFDEAMPFLEDQRIAEKIRSCGIMMTLPGCLHTSARRFESEGFYRRYFLMGMMMGLHSAGVDAFFKRAPEVYRVQHDTGKLSLSPFFRLILSMMVNEWGAAGTLRIFYRLGSYLRQNIWQLFFFVDVSLLAKSGSGRYPLLSFHDRSFAKCLNFAVVDAVAGLFCFIWYVVILSPILWLAEHKIQKHA
jgi:rSAM/selenodomain-associated transferase 2